METPSTAHITAAEFEDVYEPAEDSFLLLDALEKDMDVIRSRQPLVCVELGSGSGIIISALGKLVQSNSHCMAVDISSIACQVTKRTALANNANVDVLNMNLLAPSKIIPLICSFLIRPTFHQDSIKIAMRDNWNKKMLRVVVIIS